MNLKKGLYDNQKIFNDNQNEDGWLFVFGFHPSQTNEVLRFLSQNIGQIKEDRREGAQCNWIEVLFQSNESINIALTYNGKLIPNLNIRIGVSKKGKKIVPVKKSNEIPKNIFITKDFKEPSIMSKIFHYVFGY